MVTGGSMNDLMVFTRKLAQQCYMELCYKKGHQPFPAL